MINYEIFFSDLKPEAQAELMKAVGITDPSEMNWDIDICPIGIYPISNSTEGGQR